MPRPTLTSIWLCSVSPMALHFGLEWSRAFTPANNSGTIGLLGLLTRFRIWLSLIFKGEAQEVMICRAASDNDSITNRRMERAAKRPLPLARSTYALGQILVRRYGYSRFAQWFYRFTLSARVDKCFRPRHYLWTLRQTVAGCAKLIQTRPNCAAPLRPD